MTVHHGDCRAILATFADASIDAIVTDPPYGLEFMGKDWDAPWQASSKSALFGKRDTTMPGFGSQRNATCLTCKGRLRGKTRCECEEPRWDEAPSATNNRQMLGFQDWFYDIAVECLRVLKPGGHLLAFGGTRTYHRMAVAIEDAGFEIRDSIHWLYGSGFPKSLDVSKAIDKAAGAEREVVGSVDVGPDIRGGNYENARGRMIADITAPATDAAKQWDGWGTALKPAHEPIVVARKPLAGTVAANVLQYGTGAINVDGGRVANTGAPIARVTGKGTLGNTSDGYDRPWQNDPAAIAARQERADAAIDKANAIGRWPANIVFTHTADCGDQCAEGCPVAALDEQSGVSRDGVAVRHRSGGKTFGSDVAKAPAADMGYGGEGGASRFFTVTEWDVPFRYIAKPSKRERNAGLGANHHPTVKPLALMRWLVRLVTPPGGIVLDPFLGSGTTAAAAVLEGFDWVGCEMTAEYLPIIEGRVAWAHEQAGSTTGEATDDTTGEVEQMRMFG